MAAVLDNFFSWLGTLILLMVAVSPLLAWAILNPLTRSRED
jgi:hypothetical protein